MAEQNSETHFTKIFWFGFFNLSAVYIYLFAITFFPIPKENQRFVDISIGILIGSVINGIIGFFYGGSSQLTKKTSPQPGTTTSADISVSTTTEPENKTEVK